LYYKKRLYIWTIIKTTNIMKPTIKKNNRTMKFNDPLVSYVLDEETGLWGIVSYNFIMYDIEVDPFYVEVAIGDEIEINNNVPGKKNKYEHISLNNYLLQTLQDISYQLEKSQELDKMPEIQEWIKSNIIIEKDSPKHGTIETTWIKLKDLYS